MIKLVKSKGIVFSAFLICSFYYIASLKSKNGTAYPTDFEILEEKLSSVQYPNEVPTATTVTVIAQEADPIVYSAGDAPAGDEPTDQLPLDVVNPSEEILSDPLVSDEPDNWNEIFKITAAQIMNAFSQLKPTSEELESLTYEAVAKQKLLIIEEMSNYTANENWTKLLMKNGGKPIRNVIFTTWRSGSTFLGEVITSHPATLYHYEPLLHFDIVQVRSGNLATEGIRALKNLLQCDYSNLDEYIKYFEEHNWLHSHNWRLYKPCKQVKQLCMEPKFLSEMCQLFPFQIMKTVRMRLALAEELLIDENLDVRIIFLVRDPRGTIQSRKHRDWCPPSPDCSEPKRLCSDMVDDYFAAIRLRAKYPEKIMIIRYEDLSLNPYTGVRKVLEFFRLSFDPLVENFLNTHTGKNAGGVSSTFRDSKTTPFRWINYFKDNIEELMQIQEDCGEAMKLWGYDTLNGSMLLKSEPLIPLLKPPWEDMIILNDAK